MFASNEISQMQKVLKINYIHHSSKVTNTDIK